MAAEILMESYLMATGFAALMGADSEHQHLFARSYDQPVTVDQLKQHWDEFAPRIKVAAPAPQSCCSSPDIEICRCHAHWHPHRRGPECRPRQQTGN